MRVHLEVRLPNGKSFPLECDGDQISIGRDPNASLTFEDNDAPTVSWNHARMAAVAGRVLLEDLGSSNGTFVNGKRVEGELTIRTGDTIHIGQGGPVVQVISLTIADEGPSKSRPASPKPFAFLPPEEPSHGPAVSPKPLVRDPILPAGGRKPAAPLGQHPQPLPETPSRPSTRALVVAMQKSWNLRWLVVAVAMGAVVVFSVILVFIAVSRRDRGEEVVQQLVRHIEPSVVVIQKVDRSDRVFQGSGFVLDEQGTIATNFHVIEGAARATVNFHDGTSAEVVGFVAVSPGKDLALLRVASSNDVKPLTLAGSIPSTGTRVLAFGSPEGFRGSVSEGIVSATRSGSEVAETLRQSGSDLYRESMHYDDDATWIETTSRIMHGNSGGPLVNLQGEVVGVNTWGPSDTLNFASSSRDVRFLQDTMAESSRPLSELPRRQ